MGEPQNQNLQQYQSVVWPDYHLEKEIGQGGYSRVFKAIHLETSQEAAIKISDQIDFESEAQILKNLNQLNHPHIVQYLNHKTNSSSSYLALEYLNGQSLINFKFESIHQFEPIFLQICDAVEHLHELNVFHLDIKPSNIFLVPDNLGSFSVKIIDFGSACDKLNQIESFNKNLEKPVGTPGFVSPEQLLEKNKNLKNYKNILINQRADIYSLGCLLGFVLNQNKNIFKAHPDSTTQDILKAQLTNQSFLKNNNLISNPKILKIINKATEFDPNKRFQSVAEFSDAVIST